MRAAMRAGIVVLGIWLGICGGGDALAGPRVDLRRHYKEAGQRDDAGDYEGAIARIDEGLAVAPGDRRLLEHKGRVLVKLRDYEGALAAYEAYLAAGARGAKRREAEKIVRALRAVKSTFLDISLANGPATIYLDSRAQGVFCAATSPCHKAVLPGNYRVIVERPGFERWTGRVTVKNSETTRLSVTLVEKPSQLIVYVTPAGARVSVDAVEPAPTTIGGGAHHVVVSLAGHETARHEVVAHEGQPVELVVALTQIRVEPQRAVPPGDDAPVITGGPSSRFTLRRKLAVVAGGASLVGVAAGIVLGVQAQHLDRDGRRRCPVPEDPCGDATRADELNRRATSRARQANIGYGLAGASAIAAAVLWLTGAPESRVAISARVDSVTGFDLAVRF